jgi:hypothetical protein
MKISTSGPVTAFIELHGDRLSRRKRGIKRRPRGRSIFIIPASSTIDRADAQRPTREEAIRLNELLSQCNTGALGVIAELDRSLMLLKDARLEASTALDILVSSNRRAASLPA